MLRERKTDGRKEDAGKKALENKLVRAVLKNVPVSVAFVALHHGAHFV